jgi:hypothetical protein
MFASMSAVRSKAPAVNVQGSVVLHCCCSHLLQDRCQFHFNHKHNARQAERHNQDAHSLTCCFTSQGHASSHTQYVWLNLRCSAWSKWSSAWSK